MACDQLASCQGKTEAQWINVLNNISVPNGVSDCQDKYTSGECKHACSSSRYDVFPAECYRCLSKECPEYNKYFNCWACAAPKVGSSRKSAEDAVWGCTSCGGGSDFSVSHGKPKWYIWIIIFIGIVLAVLFFIFAYRRRRNLMQNI